MAKLKKQRKKEELKKASKEALGHTEDLVKDFVEELMGKDWKGMLESEIKKIKGSAKSKGKKSSKSTNISVIAAFAIGYMLGSLRR